MHRVRFLFLLAATLAAGASHAATTTGFIPINDLGANYYLGQYQGGLYPGGSNVLPAPHAQAGLARAGAIVPRDTGGSPAPGGKYVFLSIGMSNTTQEFSTFMPLAAAHPSVNHSTLRIVDGAAGGQSAATWDSPLDTNYDRVRDQELAPLGLTESQVQIAWVKVANPGPTSSLPNANADANILVQQMGNITRALDTRYPNLQQVFFSSRIYAGYATTTLNPEPYAYESAFAVKRVIQAQIDQMDGLGLDPLAGDLNYNTGAPWTAWGPYLWADGTSARSDGLTWIAGDFAADGTHPATTGRQKVANMLMDFLLTSPQTQSWFTVPEPSSACCLGATAFLLLRRRPPRARTFTTSRRRLPARHRPGKLTFKFRGRYFRLTDVAGKACRR